MRTEIERPSSSTVESLNGDVHLGRPTPVRARARPVANDLPEPADGRLGSSPPNVTGGLLPGRASVFGDALQMVAMLHGRGRGRLARHGRGT